MKLELQLCYNGEAENNQTVAFPLDNPDGSSGNTSDTLLPAELFLYVIFNFTFFWREKSISWMHGYCLCVYVQEYY